ncbi:MAG TPA: S1C family serine protease, partial [Candidatus Angelobacter sp.]|nr:S1C family serine protease [Candidatus Angelobacter sp.]
LQVSAPISPGNSGGPVYDELGNLLGIVTSKVARSMEPDAENLNFAISTDALLHEADWEMVSGASAPKNLLADFVRQTKVRKAPADVVSAR